MDFARGNTESANLIDTLCLHTDNRTCLLVLKQEESGLSLKGKSDGLLIFEVAALVEGQHKVIWAPGRMISTNLLSQMSKFPRLTRFHSRRYWQQIPG